MNIVERAKAPTPKFFRILRSVGLGLLALSGTILTAPIAIPVAIVTVAGYAAVVGGVLSAVSQITVNHESTEENAGVPSIEDDNDNLARDGT
jgi:uncharacterized membrane protein HdeD (DUF308 family)